jgi:hypothetical protein
MDEIEIDTGRRAVTEAMADLDGGLVVRDVPEVESVGWYGSSVHAEDGAFAVVRLGLTDLVGEVVAVEWEGRRVVALVLAERDVPVDLALQRSVFWRLAPLWTDEITAERVVIAA